MPLIALPNTIPAATSASAGSLSVRQQKAVKHIMVAALKGTALSTAAANTDSAFEPCCVDSLGEIRVFLPGAEQSFPLTNVFSVHV
jgi:hypothetical protein